MSEQNAVLGIDVGSVAVSMVKMTEEKITACAYSFHHGDIEETIAQLAGEIGVDGVGYIASTASSPHSINAQMRVDNQIAVIEAAMHFNPDAEAVLMVGGEKFFLSSFDVHGNYLGSASNTSCAAGTGSFLDQQASRLKMDGIEQLSATALQNMGDCPKIASRCAVFAKTDLIHAQQEGYQFEEISDGLCRGLAKNIVDTVFTSSCEGKKIVFCGGVSKNRAVADHIEELASVSLYIPEQGHLYGAMGAALALLKSEERPPAVELAAPADIIEKKITEKKYYYPPLSLSLSTYPDFSSIEQYRFNEESNNPVEVDVYEQLNTDSQVHLGIDVGSTSTKAVLMDGAERVLAGFYLRTAGRPLTAVQAIFAAIDDIERRKKIHFKVEGCATTGSGRKFIGRIVGADAVIDEITAHARAATQLNPQVDTIIEIGGQDAKFTTLRDGRVTSSTMNNVCAAGTGSFIEEQAARLGCSIEQYSSRTENVRAPMASDRCTVFMERDINHHLNEGFSVEEVLASALHSVRENYLMKVAAEKNIGETIFFQGATAKNKALVAAFEQRLQKPILVSKLCHLTGAYGAALVAAEENKTGSTDFNGIGLYKADIHVTSEICEICNNNCKISVADTPHGKVAYGFLCGREYDNRQFVPRQSKGFDLLRQRRSLLELKRPDSYREAVTIGLPAAVHMVDDLHFWQKFFADLSIKTISGSLKSDAITKGKEISRSEFCAPITALHGQVADLLDKSDYVFLPYYLENRSKEGRRQFCYYTQFSPGVIATMGKNTMQRVLSPIVRYLYTSFHTKIQLYRMLQNVLKNPPGFIEVSLAFDNALEFDRKFRRDLITLHNDLSRENDDVEVVLLGRPYSILSPSMNCSIPSIFASLGVNAYFQDMVGYSDEDVKNIRPLLTEIHWTHSAKILEVAEVVSRKSGVYPVFITSFKCSPDSFVVDYFKRIMEENSKPYLILELDGHDSSVGYETRIEAAVRSFRNHFQQQNLAKIPDYRAINPNFAENLGDKDIVVPNWDRITCQFLASTLKREGYNVYVMEETDLTIRQSLRFNSGQCIPLNAIAEGFVHTMRINDLRPDNTLLWLNESTLACNIKLYPYHIKSILESQGIKGVGIYTGALSLTDVSMRAAMNAYFSYMFGGLLRRVACSIRPYELEPGRTDRVLEKSIKILSDAFQGKRSREEALTDVISQFEWIETRSESRPKVAIFGDLYVRDNRVMNQDLIRYIEQNGGEVITTPYSEYAKMIATAYFRKWFNEGKFFDVLSSRAILATMTQLEKKYSSIFNRILGDSLHSYDDEVEEILAEYNISRENTGESMDNILKIHYLAKYYPDISLFVQASPALCCASIITEAMRREIEEKTGIPVVSVVYDGTGGQKNSVILPYLKYGEKKNSAVRQIVA